MRGGCCTKVGSLENLQSRVAGLVARRRIRPPRGNREVLATHLTPGEIDPLDFVTAHRIPECFVQQPPRHGAAPPTLRAPLLCDQWNTLRATPDQCRRCRDGRI